MDQPLSLVENMENCLSAEEVDRARRLIRPRDRERFIVSRGLLRYLLSSLTGKKPESLRFQYGPYGKPMLQGYDWAFNLSHSHDYVCIAVSAHSPVGVDLERIRPEMEVDKLADLVMSASEKAEWIQLQEKDRQVAFFRLWTRKEAVVKAAGEGLSRSLPGFSVGWQPDHYEHVDCEGAQWEVVSIHITPGYEAALCVRKGFL
ncbi:4'-phosphopantetheinyl transferase [Desmospora activa DSM 45169]|uniref:4'-phosphopantetheinyl transferase n=1 Tax=Desmospora activa DSM 45169 TaxID=1121389 RepID=A0A2T4ZAS8_9BACL|nr:4'-phosphopantetheinyl transferase [Desmospora activa DSM 45169]